MKTLYYSRNPNPRLALAVARHLNVPVSLEWASPFSPDQAEKFKALNPTQLIPILVEEGQPLWEGGRCHCMSIINDGQIQLLADGCGFARYDPLDKLGQTAFCSCL